MWQYLVVIDQRLLLHFCISRHNLLSLKIRIRSMWWKTTKDFVSCHWLQFTVNQWFQVEAPYIQKTHTWNVALLLLKPKQITVEATTSAPASLRVPSQRLSASPDPSAPPSSSPSSPTRTGIRATATWKPSGKSSTMPQGPWRSAAPSLNQRVLQGPTFRSSSTKRRLWRQWRPL